jgi:hypothetical protein
MSQAAKVTTDDLVADWRVRRNALDREMAFRENCPGVAPALPLKKFRQMALDLAPHRAIRPPCLKEARSARLFGPGLPGASPPLMVPAMPKMPDDMSAAAVERRAAATAKMKAAEAKRAALPVPAPKPKIAKSR